MFKKHFSCALWLGILNLPLAWFYSLAYTPQGDTPWFVTITFIFAVTGQLFIYFALCAIVFIFPVFNWRKHIGPASFIYATCIMVIGHLLLNIDAHLFDLYSRHLIDFTSELTQNAIDWQSINWLHWGIQLLIAAGYSSLMLGLAIVISSHGFHCRILAVLMLIMYLLSSAVFMFANSRQVQPLVDLETKNLPGFINLGQILSTHVGTQINQRQADREANAESTVNEVGAESNVVTGSESAENPSATALSSAEAASTAAPTPNVEVTQFEGPTGTIANPNALSNGEIAESEEATPQADAKANQSSPLPAAEPEETPLNSPKTTDEVRDPRDFAPFENQ